MNYLFSVTKYQLQVEDPGKGMFVRNFCLQFIYFTHV